MALGAVRMEILQQAGTLGAGEGCAVDPAVQLPDGIGGDLRTAEQADITGPAFPDPGTHLPVGIVVARGDEHGDLHPFQRPVDGLIALPGIGTVEDIARQQHQVAALPQADLRDPARGLQQA